MEHEIKIIPDQKLAIINYKGPIEDLDILVSKLSISIIMIIVQTG